jgi:hypothetical protein
MSPDGPRGFRGRVVQLSARPRSRSMLVEVSGPCGTAKSDTLRPKRLPIHIGSAGERARPPVLNFFVLDQMNRTEPKSRSTVMCVHLTNPARVLRTCRLACLRTRDLIDTSSYLDPSEKKLSKKQSKLLTKRFSNNTP